MSRYFSIVVRRMLFDCIIIRKPEGKDQVFRRIHEKPKVRVEPGSLPFPQRVLNRVLDIAESLSELMEFKENEVLKRRIFLQLTTVSILLSPCIGLARLQSLLQIGKQVSHPVGIGDKNAIEKDFHIKDYLTKIRNPDLPHRDDIVVVGVEKELLHNVVCRLTRLCRTVGYGNFGVLGFEDAVRYARHYSAVGPFTRGEFEFLEKIFERDAYCYGFMGEKQISDLFRPIAPGDVIKIPGSGNFLFRGDSFDKYVKIKADLGEEVLLTSGIRGMVKQFYLFLNKADRHEGNLSLASRSLAPPGYSYHASGDFDIGQKGFGAKNFSERFTATTVFKKLTEQGYVENRYLKDNMLGVRYEPWHIKL